jgi:hypothetical protein
MSGLKFDHLMWGAASLEQGMAVAERLFAVAAAPGGAHSGLGTCNALLSLGDSAYLEIIAPDPQQASERAFVAGLKKLPEPALITWAVASNDLAGAARRAQAAGLQTRGPVATQRQTPSGDRLAWELLYLVRHDHAGLMPFAIDWQRSPHPALNNPLAGQFQRLELGSPDAVVLSALFAEFEIEVEVVQRAQPTMLVEIETPGGKVQLRSDRHSLALLG